RRTRFSRDWSSDVCSSDLEQDLGLMMPGEDFRQLTAKADRHDFAVDTADISVNLDNHTADRDQLHSAIKKFTGLRIQQRLEDTLDRKNVSEGKRGARQVG